MQFGRFCQRLQPGGEVLPCWYILHLNRLGMLTDLPFSHTHANPAQICIFAIRYICMYRSNPCLDVDPKWKATAGPSLGAWVRYSIDSHWCPPIPLSQTCRTLVWCHQHSYWGRRVVVTVGQYWTVLSSGGGGKVRYWSLKASIEHVLSPLVGEGNTYTAIGVAIVVVPVMGQKGRTQTSLASGLVAICRPL